MTRVQCKTPGRYSRRCRCSYCRRETRATIELLRCAADCAASDRCIRFLSCGGTASRWLDANDRTERRAERAVRALVPGIESASGRDEYIAICLEAALRLELGE